MRKSGYILWFKCDGDDHLSRIVYPAASIAGTNLFGLFEYKHELFTSGSI